LNKLRGDKRELEQKTKMLEQQVRGFSKQLGRMKNKNWISGFEHCDCPNLSEQVHTLRINARVIMLRSIT
jgi:hypothetical protein